MGRVTEALGVYNLMRLETEEGNLPDVYSYSALMRAVLVSERTELTQMVSWVCDKACPKQAPDIRVERIEGVVVSRLCTWR
jgi:hypothetical protein